MQTADVRRPGYIKQSGQWLLLNIALIVFEQSRPAVRLFSLFLCLSPSICSLHNQVRVHNIGAVLATCAHKGLVYRSTR